MTKKKNAKTVVVDQEAAAAAKAQEQADEAAKLAADKAAKAQAKADKEAMKAAKKAEKDAKLAADKAAKEAEKAAKPPGVIAIIFETIEAGPATKEKILKKLVEQFPDRQADAMKATINAQLPNRLSKSKGVTIARDEEKRYFIEAQ